MQQADPSQLVFPPAARVYPGVVTNFCEISRNVVKFRVQKVYSAKDFARNVFVAKFLAKFFGKLSCSFSQKFLRFLSQTKFYGISSIFFVKAY